MGDLVEFKKKGPQPGYLAGPYICLGCKHRWEAVRPIGASLHLECPECHVFMTAPVGPIERAGQHWHCDCDRDANVFAYSSEWGMYCILCGTSHNPLAEARR